MWSAWFHPIESHEYRYALLLITKLAAKNLDFSSAQLLCQPPNTPPTLLFADSFRYQFLFLSTHRIAHLSPTLSLLHSSPLIPSAYLTSFLSSSLTPVQSRTHVRTYLPRTDTWMMVTWCSLTDSPPCTRCPSWHIMQRYVRTCVLVHWDVQYVHRLFLLH